MSFAIKKKDSSEVIEPEIVSDGAVQPQKEQLSPSEAKLQTAKIQAQAQIAKGSIEAGKAIATGLIEIGKIRETGLQKIEVIRAQTAAIIKKAELNIEEQQKKHTQWNERFDRRKEIFLTSVRMIKEQNLSSEATVAYLEALKELLKNEP